MAKPCLSDLNRLIEVGKMVQTTDAEGGLVDAWVPEQQVWAKVRHYTGRESDLTEHGGLGYAMKTVFTVRFTQSITANHGVMLDGEFYDIQRPVSYQGGREWLELIAMSHTADGR